MKTAGVVKPRFSKYGRKRPFLRGPENFFSEKKFCWENFFFAQFSKLSHFEHKNAKKNFSVRIPCKWPRDFTSENFSEFLKFFHMNCFGSILSTWNGLKWLLVIAIMFCFIHCSVKWSEKVWCSGNSAKNGQKIGKICQNQGFWHFDQKKLFVSVGNDFLSVSFIFLFYYILLTVVNCQNLSENGKLTSSTSWRISSLSVKFIKFINFIKFNNSIKLNKLNKFNKFQNFQKFLKVIKVLEVLKLSQAFTGRCS